MELSLHSGSEYQVFFMLDLKDESLLIEDIEAAIDELKERTVPIEFHNMTILFNDRLLRHWYPKIREHRLIPEGEPYNLSKGFLTRF